MAGQAKQAPRKHSGFEERRSKSEIKHSFGTEERIEHVRGRRSASSSIFYNEAGQIDVGITLAQTHLSRNTSIEKCEDLRAIAEGFLRLRSNDFEAFCKNIAHIDLTNTNLDNYKTLRMLWWSITADKYGEASTEAMAAHFLFMLDYIVGCEALSKPDPETIFAFCEVWSNWKSEVDGEHLAASQSVKSQLNLRKAGPARARGRQERLAIVRKHLERHLESDPSRKGGASTAASNIQDAVNHDLNAAGQEPYKLSSLSKVVGELMPPRVPKKR